MRRLIILASAVLAAGCDSTSTPDPYGPPPGPGGPAGPRRDGSSPSNPNPGPNDPLDAGAVADAPITSADGPTVVDAGGDAAAARWLLPAAPAPVIEACQRYAAAYCERYEACVPQRGLVNTFGDQTFCRARREIVCRQDLLTPGRTESPERRTACAAAISAQDCRGFYFGRPLAACDFPPGALARGAPCFRGSQCGAGLSCEIPTDEACGTCEPMHEPGGDCSFWTGGCPQGMGCYADQCLAPLKLGEACKRTAAACLGGLTCAAQGCAEANGAVGADCSRGDVCDVMKGLYCDITVGRCAANPAPVAAGQPCGVVDAKGVRSLCAEGVTCFAPASAPTRRTCIPKVAAGQPCNLLTGILCVSPAECVRNQCIVPAIVNGGPPTFQTCP
jgi:hypothetical protein